MSLTLSSVQLQELMQRCRSSIRPWGEFINFKNIKLPANGPVAGKRVLRNLDLYYGNYSAIFLVFLTFAIITSPILLLAIGLSVGVCYYIKFKYKDRNVTVFGRELNPMQQYAGIMLSSIPLLWLLGAGAAFSWVVGLTVLVTVLHSLLHNSEELAKLSEASVEHV